MTTPAEAAGLLLSDGFVCLCTQKNFGMFYLKLLQTLEGIRDTNFDIVCAISKLLNY